MDTFRSPIALLLVAFFGLASIAAAEKDANESADFAQWKLSDDMAGEALQNNPVFSQSMFPAEWHFLRTTRSEGPIETRKWLRDGRYERLGVHRQGTFNWPSEWWLFSEKNPPAVGRLLTGYKPGLEFKPGEIAIGTGDEHAVVIGWESPVAGRLEIEGNFEHAEGCCGINGQVNWYVERGPRPDVENGFEPKTLAAGRSAFGDDSSSGKFHIKDEIVEPGDFIYFIADARADGTKHPHHGDGTRFDVTVTVHGVTFEPPVFEKEILPILAARCHGCHGNDHPEAQLDLRTVSEILRGGENGPAVVPGKPGSSLLVDVLTRGQMPPPEEGSQVTNEELSLIKQWIVGNIPAEEEVVALPLRTHISDQDREFWAFQPPRKTGLPYVTHTDRVRHPIDAFLLDKLESNGLSFAPDADRRTLIRRASLALLGLPPSPEEVQDFVSDTRPDAYERMIERLLGSHHFGERWARHWLDAAGYSDTTWDNDAAVIYLTEHLWKYRDWVVRAFNENKPIDQFLVEQLAGDELIDWRSADEFTEEQLQLLIATGYLRAIEDHTDTEPTTEKKYEVLFEVVDIFSSSVLGLTMDCARCHSHKYDPIPQRDYYRLMSAFEPSLNVHQWIVRSQRMLPDVPPSKKEVIDARNKVLDDKNAEQQKTIDGARDTCRDRLLDERLVAVAEDLRANLKLALKTPADKRNEEQKTLAAPYEPKMAVTEEQLEAALTDEERQLIDVAKKKQAELNAQRPSYGFIQAMWDQPKPPTSRVLRRGNPESPGVLVLPGFPEVLQPSATAVPVSYQPSEDRSLEPVGETTGRRLALARWVTAPGHPLTARVFVNRVWHHLFGRGIVATLGNFGRSGSLPTHPELLDWLTVDFQESGWDLKRLFTQIMSSTAYRQSYHATAASQRRAAEVDADNHLLWRSNLKRLDAEIVRDALLAMSGGIDLSVGGSPVMYQTSADGMSKTDSTRRSLYVLARRMYPLKILELFDSPLIAVHCQQRAMSTTVLQSLAQLNSGFLFARADEMARRMASSAGADPAARVKLAFEVVFSRDPRESELNEGVLFLKEQTAIHGEAEEVDGNQAALMALADLCHMLMSTNEFLYVE